MDILKQLVMCHGDISAHLDALAGLGFPSDGEVVLVSRAEVLAVLNGFLCGEFDASRVERWADAIEFRDDVEFSDQCLSDCISELANGRINGGIDRGCIESMVRIISLPSPQ